MSLIKFNSDSSKFYECLECNHKNDLASIKGLKSKPATLEGGFKIYEYTDIKCEKTKLVEDLSQYSLLWEETQNNIVFTNDNQTYKTYFIYNENNFIIDEITGTETILSNALLVDEGVGKGHKDYQHIELFDNDGFSLYKVVNNEKVNTTEEEKAEWKKQFEYNVYYNYNKDNFVYSLIVTKEEIKENQIFIRKEFSKNGIPSVIDVLYDEDEFYLYKVVNNEVVNTTAHDKEEWEQQCEYNLYYNYDNKNFVISYEVNHNEQPKENQIFIRKEYSKHGTPLIEDILFDEDSFYLYKVVNNEVVVTTQEDKEEWEKQFKYNVYYNYNDNNFIIFYEVNQEEEPREKQIFIRQIYSKHGTPVIEDILFDEDGFSLYKIVNNEIVDTTPQDKEEWEQEQLEKAKEKKQAEISTACEAAIVNGVDVAGSHYSYQITDQNNIYNSMTLAIQTGLEIPYHADGENCRLYTRNELVEIYIAGEMNVTSQVTYNNQMKQYIDTLETIEEIENVQYGDELTGEYLETYNAMMTQAEEVIRHITEQN